MSVIAVSVDWNDNGDFGDSGENVTSRTLARPGISILRGRDIQRTLNPPIAGSLHAELDNVSRDYSPENGSSPLAGYLHPGHLVRVAIEDGVADAYDAPDPYDAPDYYDGVAEISLATGVLDDLIQHPERSRVSTEIPSIGTLSRLVGQRVSTALYETITVDVAIGHLLDAAGWPAGERVIAVSTTVLEWWWVDNADAWDELQRLVNSDGPGATVYEDGDGYLVFENRHYRTVSPRSNVSQATIGASGTDPVMADLVYRPPIQNIINECTVEYRKREAQSLAVVWTLGQTLTLGQNESRTFLARHSSSDPFKAAIVPVLSTDYSVSAGAVSSVSLNRTSGGSVALTITAGSDGATVTGLQLRAQLVSVAYSGQVTNQFIAATSINRYGIRTFTYPTRAEIDIDTLQEFTDTIVGLYREPRAQLDVVLFNHSQVNQTYQMTFRVSDRITITDPETGFNGDVFIEHISHQITRGAPLIQTILRCEVVPVALYGFWDISEWDASLWGY